MSCFNCRHAVPTYSYEGKRMIVRCLAYNRQKPEVLYGDGPCVKFEPPVYRSATAAILSIARFLKQEEGQNE